MYVNTSGVGKTQQQQQPLQNQTNASVRHNNPYSHTQQQPHYEHHQAPVTFVTYPFCNVAPPPHGNTGGNNIGVGGGQTGHLLYTAPHQPQSQPLPTQQQVGLHNAEQTLQYFTKNVQLPAHHLHHPPQHHTQIRNMIATVSHQRQSYMVSPNYYAFSHALMQQQTRAPILANAPPQHAVAAAGSGSMGKQLQSTAPRSIAPSGPPAYVPQPYCTPPLLLGTSPTAVAPQLGPMLTAATGMGQPPPLKAYTHINSALSAAPTPSTSINMQNVGLGVGTSSTTTEHNTNTNSNTKQRKHAIPIINPITLEIVPLEYLIDAQPQQEQQEQQQAEPKVETAVRNETNVESVSIQTDNEKSLTESIASDPSDVVEPVHTQSISATETDKIYCQMQNEDDDYDIEKQTSGVAMAPTIPSVTEANTTTQSIHSGSEFLKMSAYEDPNDTDADTNEHELDHEDDVLDATDCNLPMACVDQELPTNISIEQQTEEIPNADPVILPADESDADHSKETDAKSKDEPCTVSVQTSLDRNDEEKSKEVQEELQPSVSSFVVSESKKKKNRKAAKLKEKKQKKSKQQQNKSTGIPTQNDENKTAASANDKKVLEPKDKNHETPKIEDTQPIFIRYSLEELKSFSASPESRRTPVVPCQKGDCISQLFVARQHRQHHLSHQGQNSSAINLPQRVQQSYHQMNFNESTEMANVKRRGGFIARKYQDNGNNSASSGNNNAGQEVVDSATAGGQNHKKMQVIRINLSLNEEIKLSECKNAWQPKFLSNNSNNNVYTSECGKNGNDDIEDVLKKVRGILNKLTTDNFDVLLKEMTTIRMNTPEKMQKIMLLIFEKTVSEPNFAPTYAKFCKVLFEEVKAESKEVFNSLLINRLETEFESNVNNADAKERKLQQIIDKLNESTDPQEKIELQAELEHQEYQFRRRAWGTVRFIGEMYKLRSLSANRVLLCVESLLEHGNEEKLEYMCKLLSTVGNILENSDAKSFNSIRMNKIFEKIRTIVKESKDQIKKKIKICSRVRFMMQDLIDLRSKSWGQSSSAQSSHTTQRRRLPEDKNSNLPSSSMTTYDRSSAQRVPFGSNNRANQLRTKETGAAGTSGNFFMQKTSKSQYVAQREQYSIDLKKLNFSRGDDSSQTTTKLGNSSTYMWRTVTGRHTSHSNDSQKSDRTSPTSSYQYSQKHQTQQQQQTQYCGAKNPNSNYNIKQILKTSSTKENQRLLNQLIEEYLDCLPSRNNRWQEEVLSIWEKTNRNQQICLVYYILMDYLHLAAVTSVERNACANIFIYLMNRRNTFNKTIFTRAYEQFAEEFSDLLVDVPNGWTYVIQFLGPLLHERLITFNDIWHKNWRNEDTLVERFVRALVSYFTKEFGAKYMKDLWHKEFKLDQGQMFKSDHQEWSDFVASSKLQFLYDSKTKPDISLTNANSNSSTIIDEHVQRLQILLSSTNDSNLALDYISTNVNTNSYFLKQLTRFLCCDYATTTKTTISATSRTSSATASKNSSTCSNTSSSSSTKTPNLLSNNNNNNTKYVQLNTKAFRNNCLPLLRLCLDGHEDRELACLDSVVDAIQLEYEPNTADELIREIFTILYDEVIAKEAFENWYKQQLNEQNESKNQIMSFLQQLL